MTDSVADQPVPRRPRGRPARERLAEQEDAARGAQRRAAARQERDLDIFNGMDPILDFNVECPACGDVHNVQINLRDVLKPENIHFEEPEAPDGEARSTD